MQKTNTETSASKLHDMISKVRAIPVYELIFHEARHGVNKFMMRVTCPISSGGSPLSAEGSWGWSKKKAKHNAALTFMETFLNYKNNEQSTTAQTDSNSRVVAHGIDMCSKERDILKGICLKRNLGQPEVEDVSVARSSNALIFTAKCTVSDLCIRGKGKSKVEARLNATSRMIQILTGTASVHEILKSPQLRTSGMQSFALTSNSNENASPNDNLRRSQPAVQNDLNGKRKMNVRAPQKPEDNPKEKQKVKLHANPNRAKTLLELMNARKKTERIEDSNNNSASHVNLMHVGDNSNHKIFGTERSSTLLNNDISNCENSRVVITSSKGIKKNWTRLQAVSQIDRTLVKLEKPLYVKILEALAYSNLSYHQTVSILSHDYQVVIHESSPPKIFEGKEECTDQSIRVACLTKLLMKLRKHIQINDSKVDK